MARNQTLPASVRYQAQLQLNKFEKETRPAIVNDRCTETGRGRGVMAKFGLCRVSALSCSSYLNPALCLFTAILMSIQVSFQIKGFSGRLARCSKGHLVECTVYLSHLDLFHHLSIYLMIQNIASLLLHHSIAFRLITWVLRAV